MFRAFRVIVLTGLVGCSGAAQPSATLPTPAAKPTPTAAPPATPPRAQGANTVLDIAVSSPDHTTLVAAVKASELVYTLGSPGGIYTVFAPTNGAFEKLPPGTVEGLLKPEKKGELKKILQHHATVPALQLKDFRDGQTLGMADGTRVTVAVGPDGKVKVNGANILATVSGSNGVVHVVDAVLLPTM
ncbi:MAG: fasciclin domain-containing protein [Myxococcota bacterium]